MGQETNPSSKNNNKMEQKRNNNLQNIQTENNKKQGKTMQEVHKTRNNTS